jgi:transcriptional regulator with XRE-family HTH domain
MTFGQRLKAVRTELGLSQQDVANASGMHHSHIGNIERGGNPRLDTIARLAQGLGITPAELVERTTRPGVTLSESE